MSGQPKKLFKYHMDKNIAFQKQELQFFKRLNRWRFESANLSGTFKAAKLKGPLIFAGLFAIAYDQLYHWKKPVVFGLEFIEFLKEAEEDPAKKQKLFEQIKQQFFDKRSK